MDLSVNAWWCWSVASILVVGISFRMLNYTNHRIKETNLSLSWSQFPSYTAFWGKLMIHPLWFVLSLNRIIDIPWHLFLWRFMGPTGANLQGTISSDQGIELLFWKNVSSFRFCLVYSPCLLDTHGSRHGHEASVGWASAKSSDLTLVRFASWHNMKPKDFYTIKLLEHLNLNPFL